MIKRIAVLILSFTTLVCYGKAIRGLAGYLAGKGDPLMIAAGIAGGTAAAFLAIKLWRIYLAEFEEENSSDKDKNS